MFDSFSGCNLCQHVQQSRLVQFGKQITAIRRSYVIFIVWINYLSYFVLHGLVMEFGDEILVIADVSFLYLFRFAVLGLGVG